MQVGEALEALQRRSLIERGKSATEQATFTLQSVVLEYVTSRAGGAGQRADPAGRAGNSSSACDWSRRRPRNMCGRRRSGCCWPRCSCACRRSTRGRAEVEEQLSFLLEPAARRGTRRGPGVWTGQPGRRSCECCVGTCVALICRDWPSGSVICKASRCRMRRLPEATLPR